MTADLHILLHDLRHHGESLLPQLGLVEAVEFLDLLGRIGPVEDRGNFRQQFFAIGNQLLLDFLTSVDTGEWRPRDSALARFALMLLR